MLGPQTPVDTAFTSKDEVKRNHLSLALVSFLLVWWTPLRWTKQVNFPCCVRWGFLRENQTKTDKRNISPGVLTIESWDVFCLQQPSGLFWTLSVTSLETIWDCVGSATVCVHLSSEVEYYVCGGGLMTQACRLRFCVVNHLSHTVNDFSTSSRVMDNQNERVGWVLFSQFFNGRRRESEGPYIITVLLLCCARFSIWALTLNVAPWAKSMMDFPSWQLPLFQRSTQDEKGGRKGEGGVSGDRRGPHIEWEAAKWSLCSSSSGPVVLEGWLLQANATNCKPGNTSVQLGSLCGTQSLQQVEACKAGTEREYREKTQRASQKQTQTQ